MSILVVEDSPTRIKSFRSGFTGASTTVLITAKLAISWLREHTPKLICLDYDLDQYGLDKNEAGNGYDVARYLVEENKRFSKTLIIIHSLNINGSERMLKTLKTHGLIASLHPHLWEEAFTMDRLTRTVRDLDNSTVNSG